MRGFEAGHHELRKTSAAEIRAALEAGGVVFLDAMGGHGPGVCLASPEAASEAYSQGARPREEAGACR